MSRQRQISERAADARPLASAGDAVALKSAVGAQVMQELAMSFEADFVNLQIWQDMNTTVAWTWDNFGSDRFYSFNVAPYQANDPKCQIVDFFWTSKNVEPPSNLFANLVVSNGATNYVQFQAIGIPSV
jgi:hypothetical protein